MYDENWLRDFPLWSYDDAHATVDDEFPDAWATFWGVTKATAPEDIDPDMWEEVKQLHSLAKRLVGAAAELSRAKLPEGKRTLPKLLRMEADSERSARLELLDSIRSQLDPDALRSPEWGQVEAFLRWEEGEAGYKERLFQTAVQIHAFPRFGCSPGAVAHRCLELLDFLVRSKGLRAREYLGRVAACYIRGMHAEMAVMSRAVLESALKDLDIEVRVEEIRRVKGKRHDSLTDWIDAASGAGALDEAGRLAAGTVRDAGDDAIHKALTLVPPAREVLEALRLVLEQIENFPRAYPEVG